MRDSTKTTHHEPKLYWYIYIKTKTLPRFAPVTITWYSGNLVRLGPRRKTGFIRQAARTDLNARTWWFSPTLDEYRYTCQNGPCRPQKICWEQTQPNWTYPCPTFTLPLMCEVNSSLFYSHLTTPATSLEICFRATHVVVYCLLRRGLGGVEETPPPSAAQTRGGGGGGYLAANIFLEIWRHDDMVLWIN